MENLLYLCIRKLNNIIMSTLKTFTVSVTFTDMVADNPLEAAKKACKWLLEDNDANTMIYDVEDETTNEKFSVDLSEPEEDAVQKIS